MGGQTGGQQRARPQHAPSAPPAPRPPPGVSGEEVLTPAGPDATPFREGRSSSREGRVHPPAPRRCPAQPDPRRRTVRGARRPRRGGGPTLGRCRAPGAGRRQLPSDATVLNATEPCTSQWRKRSTLHYGLPQEKSRNEKSGDRESREPEPNGAEGVPRRGGALKARVSRRQHPHVALRPGRSRSVRDTKTGP